MRRWSASRTSAGRQAVAGQRGGTRVFPPAPDARILLGLLPAARGRFRIDGQHGAGRGGPQLPAGLMLSPGEHAILDRPSLLVVENSHRVGDDPRLQAGDAAS